MKIVGLPVTSLHRLAEAHPYTNSLIEAGEDLHILLGPEKLDRVGHISASLQVSDWQGRGHFALYVSDFDTEAWAQNWMRLAGYLNYDEPMVAGPQPRGIHPIKWPEVLGSPGMLWGFDITSGSAEEFKKDLSNCIAELWKYSYDVIQNTAEEYAFNMASTCFSDLTCPPPKPL